MTEVKTAGTPIEMARYRLPVSSVRLIGLIPIKHRYRWKDKLQLDSTWSLGKMERSQTGYNPKIPLHLGTHRADDSTMKKAINQPTHAALRADRRNFISATYLSCPLPSSGLEFAHQRRRNIGTLSGCSGTAASWSFHLTTAFFAWFHCRFITQTNTVPADRDWKFCGSGICRIFFWKLKMNGASEGSERRLGPHWIVPLTTLDLWSMQRTKTIGRRLFRSHFFVVAIGR